MSLLFSSSSRGGGLVSPLICCRDHLVGGSGIVPFDYHMDLNFLLCYSLTAALDFPKIKKKDR